MPISLCRGWPLVILAVLSTTISAAPVLEEVVVTAQKRSENLQDVSISVAAFGESELKNLGVNNLEQLTEFVNGAELFDDRGAGQPTWVIRGVGLADFNANNTPTAGIFYDEVYLTSNVLGGIGLFDVARVEVLKGPQGGLYGRNTSGGAVRVQSGTPGVGDELNGYVTGSYGSWERSGLEGAVSFPLGDSAAIRISGATDQGGGWQDSLATPGDDEHGDRDFTAARAVLSIQPGTTSDIRLKVEGGQDKSETTLAYLRGTYDLESGDFCSQALNGRHDENNCFTISNLTNTQFLTPGDPGLLPSGQDLDGSKVISSPINQLDNDWFAFTMQANFDTDIATWSSITGYADYQNNQVYDFDGSPLALFEEDSRTKLELWSQEFRAISNSDGPLSWLAGAMYAEDEIDDTRLGNLGENLLFFPATVDRGFRQETKSWAIYGQLDYWVAEEWKIHGSIRYTDEKKDFLDAFTNVTGVGFPIVDVPNQTVEIEKHWSGHIGLDWAAADNALVYGRITSGFKSGGFFGGFALEPEELRPYAEERVIAYEVGFKTQWFGDTVQLNGAAFFYDYQDAQGFVTVFSEQAGGAVLPILGTIGDAEHTGAELDFVWLPLEGLTLGGSLAWLDAEIVDSNVVSIDEDGAPSPLEGLKREFSPDWSVALQGEYQWPIGEHLLASVQLNYSWRDDVISDDALPSNVSIAAFSHEAYDVLNGRFSIGSLDQKWSVSLVGANVTDEKYWARTSSDGFGGYVSTPTRPASYAIEATYNW